VFALLFSAVAVAAFWARNGSRRKCRRRSLFGESVPQGISVTILVGALAVALLPPAKPSTTVATPAAFSETSMLQAMEAGEDHIDPMNSRTA